MGRDKRLSAKVDDGFQWVGVREWVLGRKNGWED